MPPPDTTLIKITDTNFGLPQKPLADSISFVYIDSTKTSSENKPKEHWGGLLIFAAIFLNVVWIKERLTGWIINVKNNISRGEVQDVIEDKGNQYHEWLVKCNPYYVSLSKEMQQVFLGRVVSFMQAKQFHYHKIAFQEYIPVLISGAAVQLTFGLKHYLLDYFKDIHVMKKEYVLSVDNDTYYGHVSKTGIHISWNHFMHGYSDYTDSINVGLHEMAHALQYDAYLGYESSNDRDLKVRLAEYSEEGRPVFRAMRRGFQLFFDEYAMTNFDEFWAVSVENFFENPNKFKEHLPVLYAEMCELLNQDPLLPHKIINAERI